jgi:hypothetical protein
MEIEPYVRVDVGPPEGADGFKPPTDLVHHRTPAELDLDPTAVEKLVLVAWFRNLQVHASGFAIAIISRFTVTAVDHQGTRYSYELTLDIPYLEPRKCVKIDLVTFPNSFRVECSVSGLEYRNIYSDRLVTRHGRTYSLYQNGQWMCEPVGDAALLLSDRLYRLWTWLYDRVRLVRT